MLDSFNRHSQFQKLKGVISENKKRKKLENSVIYTKPKLQEIKETVKINDLDMV